MDHFGRYHNETRPTPPGAWSLPGTPTAHWPRPGCSPCVTEPSSTNVGVGRAHKRKRVIVLVADIDIRVLSEEGELLRHLTLDPTRGYQPQT